MGHERERETPRGAPAPARRRWALALLLAVTAAVVLITVTRRPLPAVAEPALPLAADRLHAADLTRPRLALRAADIPVVQARLNREPYRSLLRDAQARADAAPPPSAADQADCVLTVNRDREAAKDGAAFELSFLYLIDRVYDPGTGQVVQPDPVRRQAIGDRAAEYLRFMCTESRIKVQADRDINTSHELLSAAMAYDDLAGAGYPFAGSEATIVDNLVALTGEYYGHYNDPTNPNFWIAGASRFAVNNHRSKGAASIGAAAIVLAEYQAAPGTDPDHRRDPARWLDFALDRVDLVQRYTYGAGDGGYGEGPGYWRYAGQNVVPFAHAWDRLVDGATVQTAAGVAIPSLWRQPQFALMQRWALDLTLPDGTLAPIDDAKTGERPLFGLFPAGFPGQPELAWRWQHADVPYERDGNIDVGLLQLVSYDDTVASSSPAGSPVRFYPDGGDAVLRSDWSPNAVMALVLGEHGPAREFGRTRDGTGEAWSAAHDQADPGSFLLHAYGERLLLDPGYMDFPWSQQQVINKPSDHNMILVDRRGDAIEPVDPFAASSVGATLPNWLAVPGAPDPADGDAQLSGTLDSPGLAGVSVTARYGAPATTSALVQRRFLFVDNTYLVTADHITAPTARTLTWPIHGNAGGQDGLLPAQREKSVTEHPPEGAPAIAATPYTAAGGTFTQLPAGGEWSRSGARVTVGLAFDGGTPAATAEPSYHELRRNTLGQHTALYTEVQGDDVRAVTVDYPTPAGQAAPIVERGTLDGAAVLRLTDAAGDRRVFVMQRSTADDRTLDATVTGARPLRTDATTLVLDTHLDGSLRSLSVEGGTRLEYDGTTYLTAPAPATLSVRLAADHADLVADTGAAQVEVTGLPFTPVAADATCGVIGTGPGTATVTLGRERRFSLWAVPHAGRPAADPGPAERHVAVGDAVVLDGRASCDPEGGATAPTWQLVSAPPASSWSLTGGAGWQPVLRTDAPGPYRVRLTVTDATGQVSASSEVLVIAGPLDTDGLDNDLDGRFDRADPDLDLGVAAPPVTTTTTSVPPSTTSTTVPVTVSTAAAPTDAAAFPPVPASSGPSGAAPGGASTVASGALPSTGTDSRGPVALGIALVLGGAALLAWRRARRRVVSG